MVICGGDDSRVTLPLNAVCQDVATFVDKPLSVCFDDPSSVPRESRVDFIVATILSTPDIFRVSDVAVASIVFGNVLDGFTFCDCIVNDFDGCDVIVYDIILRDAVSIDAIMEFPVNGFDVVAMGARVDIKTPFGIVIELLPSRASREDDGIFSVRFSKDVKNITLSEAIDARPILDAVRIKATAVDVKVSATAVLVPSTAADDCLGVAVLLETSMSLLYPDVFSASCLLEGLPLPFPAEPGSLTKLVTVSAWLRVTLSIVSIEYRDVPPVET